MPQKTRYLSFPWEREGILCLQLYKTKNLVRFLPCPPACKIFFKFRHCVDDAHQNSRKNWPKNSSFLQILHLSSNRRVRNLTLYFQFTTPARELTHRMKFEYPGRHEFWTHHVSSLPWASKMPKPIQKGTNFRDTMFLCYLEPEKCQNLPRNSTNFSNAIIGRYLEPVKHQKPTKRHEFHTKLHSLTPTTMPRKVLVFHNFAHRLKCIH